LRQGYTVAPVLFILVLEIAIRRSKVESRGTIFDKLSHIMVNADDIKGRRLQDLEVFTTLVEQTV
jgi:hypothetical protein